jgi:hypothetical protein
VDAFLVGPGDRIDQFVVEAGGGRCGGGAHGGAPGFTSVASQR